MKVCVTGASGFLGRHLVEQLIKEDGYEVRAICRNPDRWLRETGAEIVQGSILEPSELEYALEGCDAVFHLAGRVERNPSNAHKLYEIHVKGTLAVIDAAEKAGIRKFIYASTSGTVGVSKTPDLLSDDDHYAEHLCGRWPYYLSKIYAEKAVLRATELGQVDAVILRPTLLLGPGDVRTSSTGDVLRYMRNGQPIVPEGGLSFVDVRDAAAAFRAALHHGKVGETYLLGAVNLTLGEFYERLARLCGRTPPLAIAPKKIAKFSERLLWAVQGASDREFELDPVTLSMARHYWYIDWTKAMVELGFRPRDPGETLYDTVQWIKRMGGAQSLEDQAAERRARQVGQFLSVAGRATTTAASIALKVGAEVGSRASSELSRRVRGSETNMDDEGAFRSEFKDGDPWAENRAPQGLELLMGGAEDGPSDPKNVDEMKEELSDALASADPTQLEAMLWAARRARD